MAIAPDRPTGSARLQTGVAVLVTVITIALVGQHLDTEAIAALQHDLSLTWLGTAGILFLANYMLRALRFRLLTYSAAVPLIRTFGVSAIHGMFNYLLPAKLGEFAYPLLARTQLGLSIREGTATLIVARFWDFSVIAVLLPVVAIAFSPELPHWMQLSMVAFPVIFLLTVAVALWFVSHTPSPFSGPPLGSRRLPALLVSLAAGLRSVHDQGNHLWLALLSTGIWLCIYGNFYALVRTLGLETTLLEMAVVSTLLLPLTLIPIQGIANIGSHELAWVTALGLFGHDLDTSLQMAVGTHVLLLLLVLLLALAGLACISLTRRH